MLFSSTEVKQGQCWGIVAYTGMNTAIGSVHEEVMKAKEEEEDTPLKKALDDFGDKLAKVIAIICFIVWVMNFNKWSDPIHGSFIKGCIYYLKIAIALAVAAIPEGLPAVITTCLALGTRKMAANNCIVRRLASVETLGCTTVICSDKTGTLTKNEMCATSFATFGSSIDDRKFYDVEEKSYSPEAQIFKFTSEDYNVNENFKHIAANLALNSFSDIIKKDGSYTASGSTTEAALKVLAAKINVYSDDKFKKNPLSFYDSIEEQVKRVAALEFSSERKTMSVVVKGYNGV
jgi:Ca2+-transporting ATPase